MDLHFITEALTIDQQNDLSAIMYKSRSFDIWPSRILVRGGFIVLTFLEGQDIATMRLFASQAGLTLQSRRYGADRVLRELRIPVDDLAKIRQKLAAVSGSWQPTQELANMCVKLRKIGRFALLTADILGILTFPAHVLDKVTHDCERLKGVQQIENTILSYEMHTVHPFSVVWKGKAEKLGMIMRRLEIIRATHKNAQLELVAEKSLQFMSKQLSMDGSCAAIKFDILRRVTCTDVACKVWVYVIHLYCYMMRGTRVRWANV